MRRAAASGVFPGGVLLVAQKGHRCFEKAYGVADTATGGRVTTGTVFDLASLTKPLATTLAVMHLTAKGHVSLDDPLSRFLEAFSKGQKAGITIRNLLHHRSGLPAYRPYYLRLCRHPMEARAARRRVLLREEPLAHPPESQTIYSDLGFMLLREVIEAAAGMRLDQLVNRFIYAPLGITHLFYIDLAVPNRIEATFASTENCPWRKRVLNAEVHDENAFVMGGIDGHAGLFGTAYAIHRLIGALVSAYQNRTGDVFVPQWVRRFFRRDPTAGRPLGFDCPAPVDSSSGCCFSENSVGHLGYTGVSFWVDVEKSMWVVLLTNRVHPSRDNEGIKAFRPALHDAVRKAMS